MSSLEAYLDAPVDYSREFTDRVAALAASLSGALGAAVRHDTDMNYNPGQLIVVHLGPSGTVVSDEVAAAYAIKVAVSSRGPVWALMAWRGEAGGRTWYPASVSDIGAAPGMLATIGRVMESAGLSRVPDGRLEEPVPGRVTELDGAPATIRDLLFCELC